MTPGTPGSTREHTLSLSTVVLYLDTHLNHLGIFLKSHCPGRSPGELHHDLWGRDPGSVFLKAPQEIRVGSWV